MRVRRRLLDRLLSVLWPVRRYRCVESDCFWEYNQRWRDRPIDADDAVHQGSPVLDPSRLGPLP
jgi:hypothetical protein